MTPNLFKAMAEPDVMVLLPLLNQDSESALGAAADLLKRRAGDGTTHLPHEADTDSGLIQFSPMDATPDLSSNRLALATSTGSSHRPNR